MYSTVYVSPKKYEVIWAEDDLCFILYLRTWQFSQNIRPGVLFRNRMNFCCQNHIEYLVISSYFCRFLRCIFIYIYLFSMPSGHNAEGTQKAYRRHTEGIQKAYRRHSRRPAPGVIACYVQIVADCHTISKLENLWRRTERKPEQTLSDFLRFPIRLLFVPEKNCLGV